MLNNKWINKLILAALCIVVLGVTPGAMKAQSTTQGGIAGTVFDSTDAVVGNATVLIRNDGTNAEMTLTTDSSGFYKAPQVAPGTYTVTITAAGFSETRSLQVIVEVNQVTEMNAHLKTGSSTTVVEVTADVPVLNFESATYGGHLGDKEIENIPINNRRWSALALTTPGVTNSSDGFGLLSFRAISPLLNVIEVDGADDNQAFFAEERGRTRAGYSTSQGAVREFTVNTGVYGADFGRAVGGVVNTVTKSGGNQLHGEAYFYNRNSSRSAKVPGAANTVFNSTTNQYVTSPYRPKDNRNQYGFAVGGPLVKDKLFWFYAFDAYRRNFPGTAKANNPGAFFINANPTLNGTETCVNTATSTTFAGAPTTTTPGQTAATQVLADNAACTLAARLATSYAGGASAFNTQLQAFLPNLGSVPRFGNQLINTPKLDWQITSKHHVSFLYHRLRWDSPGGVQTQGTNNYAIDTFGTDFVKLDYGVAKLDSLITSRITNELRFQYGRELNDEGLQTPSAYTKANLINSTGFAPEISLNSTNGFMFGEPYYGFRPSYPDERKLQVGDTVSFSFGNHNVRVGEDIVRNSDYQNYNFEQNGFYTYSQGTTQNSQTNYFADLITHAKTCSTTGTGVNITSGIPCYNSLAQGFGQSKFQFNTIDYGFFAQDDWKIRPTLTLNLGVRYDYVSLPQPFASVANAALPQTTNRPSDKNNIAPRLGFAYDPFRLGKTVVRGGFGLYYGRIPNNYVLGGLSQTGSTAATTLATYTPTTVGAPLLPGVGTTPVFGTASAQFFAPNFQNPYGEQYDLAIQQEIGFKNVVSVSYIGAMGRALPNYINVNLDRTKTYQATYTVAAGTNGSCGPLACGSQYTVNTYAGTQCTNAGCSTTQNILLNTQYSAITESFSNINSSYNGLTVDVTNRSNKWVQFDANYTWSHALDFSQNAVTTPGTNNWIDPFGNQRLNYGNSSQNVKNRVVGWANINAPGLSGHGPLTYLTNGWSIKPYVQIQNGLPYSLLSSGTAVQQCTAVGCLKAANSGIAGTGASAYLPFFGRNTLQYPRTIEVDLRAQKAFKVNDRYNVELFGEAFNLANHQNVTGVNTTGYAITGTGTGTLTYQANFGVTSTANTNYAYGPRVIQIGARANF
ncbi:MAG TPA: TonB-dependent receptor [Acidobacteriaceae bacterium]